MSEIKALESAREHVSVYAADCDQVWMIGFLDEIQAEVDSRFMERPCDKNGEPTHIGQRIEHRGHEGDVWLIGAFEVMCSDRMCYPCCEYHHVKPRTLEDVLLDMLGSYYRKLTGSWATLTTDEELASGYADEIRELLSKAGDGE